MENKESQQPAREGGATLAKYGMHFVHILKKMYILDFLVNRVEKLV